MFLSARHAAVHHPYAARLTIAALHRSDDLLHSRHVGAIAGEHLVAERDAVPRHHQADADLLAVSPMVAAVAAAGEPIALGVALEIRPRHIIQLIVEIEQRSQALL